MKYGFLAVITAIFAASLGITGCTPEAGTATKNAEAPSTPVIIGEDQAWKVTSVRCGQTVEIRLSANATTGYQWAETSMNTFSNAPVVLERAGTTYLPDKSDKNAVGVGGTYVSKFKAVGKGKVKLTLQYLRPWEGQSSAVKTLSFEITVE